MNVRGQERARHFRLARRSEIPLRLTLFAEAAPDELLFRNLLEKYFDGDATTTLDA